MKGLTRRGGRASEPGVILVNVLVALAIGAALVTLMLTSQDLAIDQARRASNAAQAEALALGAETSVLVALRRDMIDAPDADHYGEDWYRATTQDETVLETGRFSVAIRDVQAGFDLNGVAVGGPVAQQALLRLLAALELPAATSASIAEAVRRRGPFRSVAELVEIDAEARARLAPHVSFLPVRAALNLNTADVVVMGAVLNNRTAALRLAALRERNGFVTPDDLSDLGLIPGAAAGLRSDLWDVTTRAEVDGVEVSLTSRLMRLRSPGRVEVRVVSRRFGAAPPGPLPEVGRFD